MISSHSPLVIVEGIFDDASPEFSVTVLCQICGKKISDRELNIIGFYSGAENPYEMGEEEAEKFFDHMKEEHGIAGRS